jgi:Amt family ammonium transporter
MDLQTQIGYLWLSVCTALVFFMQAGFACLEAGSVRSKNSVNVALKNVVTFIVAAAGYYLIGYALHFGKPWIDGLAGTPVPMLRNVSAEGYFNFLYQLVFCTTAATIVSGAVAERMRFLPYIIGTLVVGVFIYPVFGHWAWNDAGWLHRMGYHDFAGSSVVHMCGGFIALSGIVKVGARRGRFGANGKVNEIHASNVPLVALGVFILYFGWIGFNGGSAPFGPQTASIVLNTFLGGIFGGLTCLLVGWALKGISGAATQMNGILAGLVAITASADIVTAPSACIIGCIGGVAYLIADEILIRLRLDDAVSAVPVHGFAGLSGILSAGIFSTHAHLQAVSTLVGHPVTRSGLIGIQALGALACALWAYAIGFIMWTFIGRISLLRVTEDEELVGLNYSEHQVRSPSDEVVAYVMARVAGREVERPHDLEGGEFARILAAVQGWTDGLSKERDELERARAGLGKDADRLYEIIRRCEEENRLQSKRLEAIAHKVQMVDSELRRREGTPGAVTPLAAEVMAGVREKLAEMQAGGRNVSFYWEQLRGLGSALFANTRSLERPVAEARA